MVERNSTASAKGQGDLIWGLKEKSNLLLKLYEKSIDCMDRAIQSIERGEMIEKGEHLVRSQDIVLLLGDTLDPRGGSQELGNNLQRIYMYVYKLLIRGNTHLDIEAIEEARKHMVRLYSAWQHIAVEKRDDGQVVRRVRCY